MQKIHPPSPEISQAPPNHIINGKGIIKVVLNNRTTKADKDWDTSSTGIKHILEDNILIQVNRE